MAEKKITTAEFYTAIINEKSLPEELREKASTLLVSLSNRATAAAERSKRKNAEKKDAVDTVVKNFFAQHKNTPYTCAEIAEGTNTDFTPAGLSYAARRIGLTKTEKTVFSDGVKVKKTAYALFV